MIVKHFKNEQATTVPTVPAALALPAGLVIAPGNYNEGGTTYQCTSEGLVRFWQPMSSTKNRIVYQSDIPALMSAIAWLCVNGTADEALTNATKTNTAATSKLRVLCGKTCEWAKYLCDSLGIQTRIVRSLTAGTPNNYYDGHVMLEAKVGGVWRLFDLANDVTFGANLALKDALPLVSGTALNKIANDVYAAEPYASGVFDVSAWQELTMFTSAEKRAEFERVMQIPGIVHTDNLTYFYMPTGMESRQSWVLGLDANYRVITQAAWLTQFYS